MQLFTPCPKTTLESISTKKSGLHSSVAAIAPDKIQRVKTQSIQCKKTFIANLGILKTAKSQ